MPPAFIECCTRVIGYVRIWDCLPVYLRVITHTRTACINTMWFARWTLRIKVTKHTAATCYLCST